MHFHTWKYLNRARWECETCAGITSFPTRGEAAKKTCPGKKEPRKRYT